MVSELRRRELLNFAVVRSHDPRVLDASLKLLHFHVGSKLLDWSAELISRLLTEQKLEFFPRAGGGGCKGMRNSALRVLQRP